MTNEVVTPSVTRMKHERTQGRRMITGLWNKIDELLKAPDSSRHSILRFLQDVKQTLCSFQAATGIIASTVNEGVAHGNLQRHLYLFLSVCNKPRVSPSTKRSHSIADSTFAETLVLRAVSKLSRQHGKRRYSA